MRRLSYRGRFFAMLFVVSAAAVVVYCTQNRHTETNTTVLAAPSVLTEITHVGVFSQRIIVQGRIGLPQGGVTKLSFAEAGTLSRIDIHLGEYIHTGDSLAAIDQRAFTLALDQAHAGVDAVGALTSVYAKERLAAEHLQTLQNKSSATLSDTIAAQSQARQATLKTAADVANLQREERLFSAGIIAEKDLRAAQDQLAVDRSDEHAAVARVAAAKQAATASKSMAQTDLTVAHGDVATLEAQRAAVAAQERSAEVALDHTILRSPINGVVLAIDKHLGETVDTTSPVVEISSSRSTNVTLGVPTDQVRKIHPGDQVDLLTGNGTHSNGYVAQVLPLIDDNTQTATVIVSAEIPNAISGDVVTGSVTVARIRGIVIPSSAIVQDPQTGHTSVFVRVAHPKSDAPPFEQRDVKIAASDERQAVITEGLPVGDTIAKTAAYTLLAPNGG